MKKPSSRRPPSGRPAARRSLVELAAAASHAAEEGLPVAPLEPAAPAIDPAPRRAPVAQALDAETVPGREITEAPVELEALVAADIGAAARYRDESLELVRASLATAIDHARGLIRARSLAECVKLSSEFARTQREFAFRQAGAWKSFTRAAVRSDPW